MADSAAATDNSLEEIKREETKRIDADDADDDVDNAEIEAMKKRVQEMEAEAAKLREMQASLDSSEPNLRESREDIDARSVFIGNVDYAASPEEIQAHFTSVGPINRVTILLDKFTGNPKGYAYVEFAEPNLVTNALVLNDSQFRGRAIKVTAKRTNLPGMARGGRGGGDRGGRGGGFRGGRGGPYGGFGGGGGGYGGRGGGGYGGGYGAPRGGGGGYDFPPAHPRSFYTQDWALPYYGQYDRGHQSYWGSDNGQWHQPGTEGEVTYQLSSPHNTQGYHGNIYGYSPSSQQ